MIKCNLCGKKYFDIFSLKTKQAYGCASEVYSDNTIISHFGSSYDTKKFTFPNTLLLKKGDIVCDSCIIDNTNKNNFTEDKNYNYFG